MNRFLTLSAAALLAVCASAQELKPGSKAPDFSLQTLQGAPVDYKALKGDVTVLTWVSQQCPVSNDYNERMNALYNDYSKKGVKFIFLNSNHTESPEVVANHAKSVGFVFPVYKDANNVVADKFGAQVTPESFVIDKMGTVVYHGYIDDQRNPSKVTNPALKNALDSMIAGKAVAQTETKAFGCTLKKVKKAS